MTVEVVCTLLGYVDILALLCAATHLSYEINPSVKNISPVV